MPELLIFNTQNPLPGDQMDCHRNLTDHALDEQLERSKSHLVKLGPSLPDNGEKIRLNIASLEAEKQRRVLHRSNMVRILTTTSLISFFLSCLFFFRILVDVAVLAKTLSLVIFVSCVYDS